MKLSLDDIKRIIKETEGEDEMFSDVLFTPQGVKRIRTAHIAEDLERIAPIVQNGTEICVVGNDGGYVVKTSNSETNAWIQVLSGWLKSGGSIKYLLADKPNPNALTILRELPKEDWNKGKLRIFSRDATRTGVAPQKARRYLDQWLTFHFCIFDGPRQLWVERYHAKNADIAHDCAYFPSDAVAKNGLFDILKSRFNLVLESCCREITEGK